MEYYAKIYDKASLNLKLALSHKKPAPLEHVIGTVHSTVSPTQCAEKGGFPNLESQILPSTCAAWLPLLSSLPLP